MTKKRPRATSIAEEPIAKKAYYSIGEVCELTGLKPHVLRYWETQFESLHPNKNRAGNRVYRPKEIELVLQVKRLLYEKKFTIEGARKRLQEMRSAAVPSEADARGIDPEIVAGMRQELNELMEILTPPADA